MTRGKLTTEQIFGQKLTRQEVMQMIRETPGMYARYARLSPQLKKEFMDFCMGTCGLNLTYDPWAALRLLLQRPGDAPVFSGALQRQGGE